MEIADRLIISKPIYIREPYTQCGYCKGQKPHESDYFGLQSWYDVHSKNGGLSSTKKVTDEVEIDNCTLGIHVELVSVQQYDEFCNLGFRRSGKYLYKPDLLRNCCRLFTIRTTLPQCKVSKELKQCVKRFKKFTNAENNIPLELQNKNTGGKNKQPQKGFDLLKELYLAEQYSENNDFYTKFEPSVFSQEKYELFVKYQQQVHKDYLNNEQSFKNFLCHAPFAEDVMMGSEEEWEELNNWKEIYAENYLRKSNTNKTEAMTENGEIKSTDTRQKSKNLFQNRKTRYGPVHECYYHKGKLIALAVLDFLPTGVSSVYFIWDPDYSKWNLGKISALRELALVTILQRDYYYLGYYIDDCPKMMYKKKFGGDLLDVCNNQYVPINKVAEYIKHGKFFVVANDTETKSPSSADEEDNSYYDENDHSELPLNDAVKFDVNKPLINIAEKIYGEKEGFAIQHSNEAVAKLMEYGIEYPSMMFNDYYKLKPMIPSFSSLDNHTIVGSNSSTHSSHTSTSTSTLSLEVEEEEEEEEEEDDGDIPGYTKEIYNIPAVIPGLLPMWQIAQIIQSGAINSINNKLMLYNTRTNQVRKMEDFSKENKRVKKCICNVIRLIGLKATAKSLIII
ncbi:hypothetical protein ACO0RG_003976 [Hanseniaspora osmophila]